MKLNLYSVSDKYIKYLREFDDKIYDNKEEIRTHERKYLGVVLTVNEFNYYIPMSSPKKSVKNMDIGYIKNTVDFKLLEEKLKEWNNLNN